MSVLFILFRITKTMKHTFNEVSVKGVRKWKDQITGKPRQETKKFAQTINPWNVTKDGTPKTREQIMVEITRQRSDWESWMNAEVRHGAKDADLD